MSSGNQSVEDEHDTTMLASGFQGKLPPKHYEPGDTDLWWRNGLTQVFSNILYSDPNISASKSHMNQNRKMLTFTKF